MQLLKNRALLLSGILLVLIVVGVLFCLYYARATAQPDVITYLQERLKQQNVPVVEISILQQSPMQLQISIQSKREGEKGVPDDPINSHLVEREVVLASQRGYSVERLRIVFLNKLGKPIGTSENSVDTRNMSMLASVATIDNNATKNLINDKINLYGMTVTNMDVSSLDGLQFVTLQLSAASLEEANRAAPDFIFSLPPLLEGINAQGAQIATLKLELKDEQGNLLLNYMLDLQLHSQNWWMADGLTTSWFSQPPPVPE